MQAEAKTEQQKKLINDLIEAINRDQIINVEKIINDSKELPSETADLVNQLDSQGLSPLYVACKNNNYAIAEYLLNQGASISYDHKLIRFGAEQLSILDELAKHRDTLIIEEIIQNGLMVDGEVDKIIDDIYSKDAVGKTFFHHIFENNNPQILEVILKNFDLDANRTLDSKDIKGLTPLEYASPETMVTDKLEEGVAGLERNRSFNLRILKFLNKNDKKSNILALIENKDMTKRDSNYEIFYNQFLGVNKNLLEQFKIFNTLGLTSTTVRCNLLSVNNNTSSSPKKNQLSAKGSTDISIQGRNLKSTDISNQSRILESNDVLTSILPYLVKNLGGFVPKVGGFFADNQPKITVANPSVDTGLNKRKEPAHA